MLNSFQTSKEYRHSFIEEAIRTRLTAQVKTLRDGRDWDYKKFAEQMGKKVSWVYRLEDPNAALPTIPTLLQVAEAFDIGLDVRFRSFSELLEDVTTLEPNSFVVPSFSVELTKGAFFKARRAKAGRRGCRPRHKTIAHRAKNQAKSRAVRRSSSFPTPALFSGALEAPSYNAFSRAS